MVFNAPAKFPCDVCGERREEFYLLVNSKRVLLKNAVFEVSEAIYGVGISLRFCNDKGTCGAGAAQKIKEHVEKEKANYARSG